jgi:TolB protein
MAGVSRRRMISSMAALAALLGQHHAFAQSIQRMQPVLRESRPLPIAIPDFTAAAPADGEVGIDMARLITGNLKTSRLLAPIDPSVFAGKITTVDTVPQFADWKAIDAWVLLAGRVARADDGRLKIECRLWDVATGSQLAGAQYLAPPEDCRRVANMISDEIFQRLTGKEGHFDPARNH